MALRPELRFVIGVMLVLAAGCRGERATRRDCERILERIVEIELSERGFKDPMLTKLKQITLARKLAMELDACVGRRLGKDAMACVEAARSVEALTHECLSD